MVTTRLVIDTCPSVAAIVAKVVEHVGPERMTTLPGPANTFSLKVIVTSESSATLVAFTAGVKLLRVGAVVSTLTESAVEDADSLPASSKCVAVIDHEPPWTFGIVHVAALEVTLTEHCCLALLGPLATKRTMPPSSAVVVLTSRLEAEVTLSESELPVSDDAARSGVLGVPGAVKSGDGAPVPAIVRNSGYSPEV
jgi:hypothetical protein